MKESKCEECKKDATKFTWTKRGWVCRDCKPMVIQKSSMAHVIVIGKKKHGINMTHAEKMQIHTNKQMPDGSYQRHWRYR